MSPSPDATPIVRALPPSRPFVAPEELARSVGRNSLIRLGANESSFGPSPAALHAMRGAVEQAAWYGDPESMDLREALSAHHRCSPNEIVVGAGIDDVMGLLVRGYLAPGDVTVATLGSYPTYVYHVDGYGARLETVPYTARGTVDLDALAARANASGARQVYLANPDNPSGSFADRAAVARFVEQLAPGVLLVLDEAYADFVAPDELHAANDPRVVRLRTFSKAHGLAGARIGYALAAPEIVATLCKIRLQFGVNRIAQAGALAALTDAAYATAVTAEVARGRADYRALGERVGCPTLPSRTNFVCFDLASRERAEAMVRALLEAGIFVRKPAHAPLDGHIRVTVGTADERVTFAAAFANALAQLGPAAGVPA